MNRGIRGVGELSIIDSSTVRGVKQVNGHNNYMSICFCRKWCKSQAHCFVFSSPEHNVLKVCLCGRPMSVVRRQNLPCGLSRGRISCSVKLKLGQNGCLEKVSQEVEFSSPGS